MKKILLLIISIIVGVQGIAQQLPKGDFKIKSSTSNTIFLEKISENWEMSDSWIFLKKPCGYVDTTVYWNFYKQDSLKIETVIRKCTFNTDTSRTNKIEERDGYTTITIANPEIRTSFWEEEIGSYQIEGKYLEIKGTKKYNGKHLYTLRKNKKNIKLVLKK